MASKQKAATEPDVLDILRSAPRSTVEEVAGALGVARSTAAKRLASAIAENRVQRHAGGRESRRRLPDRYTAVEVPRVADGGRGKAGPEHRTEKGRAPRLRPGELDGLVLAHIAAHTDEAPFGATAVARELGGGPELPRAPGRTRRADAVGREATPLPRREGLRGGWSRAR